MNKLKISLLVVAACVLTVISCKKDGLLLNQHKSLSSNMRTFSSMDELFKEVEKVNSMDEEELQKYEESIGFSSFGREADVIYYPIAIQIEKKEQEFTVEQAMDYVSKYPEYLELITDDDVDQVFISKYFSASFRYVMNTNRMFRVKEDIYKVFNAIVFYTSIENADALYDITEENIWITIKDIIENGEKAISVFSITPCRKSLLSPHLKVLIEELAKKNGEGSNPVKEPHTPMGACQRTSGCLSCKYITAVSPIASNNKERVLGEFKYEYYKKNNSYRAEAKIYAQWRGGKKSVWVGCKRTLNTNYNVEIYADNTIWNVYSKYKSAKPEYSYTRELFSVTASYSNFANGSIYNLCGKFWIATTTCIL
jgi:hypothetical protein